MLTSMSSGPKDFRVLTSLRHGHSCCLSTEAEQCFHFLLIKYSQTSRNFLKWKTSICGLQVVTIDTDTPGKTRRAWNTKDLIYMAGKNRNSCKPSCREQPICGTVCFFTRLSEHLERLAGPQTLRTKPGHIQSHPDSRPSLLQVVSHTQSSVYVWHFLVQTYQNLAVQRAYEFLLLSCKYTFFSQKMKPRRFSTPIRVKSVAPLLFY